MRVEVSAKFIDEQKHERSVTVRMQCQQSPDAVATPDKNLHIMLYALTLPLVGAFLAGSAPIAPPANARSSVVMAGPSTSR